MMSSDTRLIGLVLFLDASMLRLVRKFQCTLDPLRGHHVRDIFQNV